MRAITVEPAVADSVRLDERPPLPPAAADRAWLSRPIMRRVPLDRRPEAFERRAGDVKVVIDFGPDSA